jgi:hypothetical protein
LENLDVLVSQIGWSSFRPMQGAEICSTEPNSAKLNGLVSETGGSRISRSSDNLGETTTAKPDDWRTPLMCYLENFDHITDRKVRRQTLKYVVLDNNLYHRTMNDLLFKCLCSDQSRIAMRGVHKGICGTQ